MNGLASLQVTQTEAMPGVTDPPPGLCTLSVPAHPRLPVKRQLSLPVTGLAYSPQLAGAPVIGNKVTPWPLEQQACDEETSLIDDNSEECGDCRIQVDSSLAGLPEQCPQNSANGSLLLRPQLPQPLITVTINPLEKNEMTFVPPSPMVEARRRLEEDERKLSIGSASSLDEDPEDMNSLGLRNSDIRRVSDISHINELRREISGLSHLASEFYEVKKIDPDKLSLDSIHLRVLSRCTKYQMIESKSDRASRYFVIITTSLTIFGISCGFWYRNFSGFAEDETH